MTLCFFPKVRHLFPDKAFIQAFNKKPMTWRKVCFAIWHTRTLQHTQLYTTVSLYLACEVCDGKKSSTTVKPIWYSTILILPFWLNFVVRISGFGLCMISFKKFVVLFSFFKSDSIRSLYSTRNIICTSHPCLLLSLTRWAIMYVSVGDGEKGKKLAILQTIFMAISHKLWCRSSSFNDMASVFFTKWNLGKLNSTENIDALAMF